MSAPYVIGLLMGLVAAWHPGQVAAQRTWQADVRIQALDVEAVGQGSLSIRVQVASGEHETARDTRLEILVPVGLEVVRVGPGCQPTASAVPKLAGRVSCDLGDIPVRGLREVTVVTSRPASGTAARFAAFVMSSTPDPQPLNNFAERSAQ